MRTIFQAILAMVATAMLVACGGSDVPYCGPGCTPESEGSTGAPSVVLAISTTTVAAGAPATVTATVRNGAGVAQPGQVVQFSTSGGLGVFNTSSALTDASGAVTVQVSPASPTSNGADLVIAKVSVADAEVSGTIGFQVTPSSVPPVGSPSLSIALSTTTVASTAPATVTSVVKDAAGNPLANAVVKFKTIDSLGAFNPPSALTDSNGMVSVMLSPATTTTNGADLAVATAVVDGVTMTATAGFSARSAGAPATGTPSIALTLSSTVITASTPATALAVVKDTTGAGVPGLVVKFETVDALGKFNVSSALTDATGSASAVLTAGASGGADQVLAKTTVNGSPLQASQGFQVVVPVVTIAGFSSDIGAAALDAYGQTSLTASVAGAAPGTPVALAITSDCVTKGKATVTPSTTTTTSGVATFTYRDAGCGAISVSDLVRATIPGTTSNRQLNIALTGPTASNITFTSATPETIYLKGSGLTETSTVVFTVVDTAGNGLPNQTVTLEPTTLSGGLTIDGGSVAVSKVTDSLGRATALINSGTVPTPVRIKATLASATTVSSTLSIAVGLPAELNFSLSQKTLNIEGYDIDGTSNTYSIIASDRLANPVPTGTSINFIAEGGQIEPIKTTALSSGIARAAANFVSASPRPLDGRITVLAYALGEESFLDTNGNNIWDQPADTQFQDLGAVFLSRSFINTYKPAVDQLIPLAIPGTSTTSPCVAVTSPLLALNATIPTVGGSTCDGKWGQAYVRRAAETVLSTSVARPIWSAVPAKLYANPGRVCPVVQDTTSNPAVAQNLIVGYDDTTGVALRPDSYTAVSGTTTLYGMLKNGVLSFMLADNNPVRLNPVAAGSLVSVAGTTGLSVAVMGGSPVPSSLNATFVSVSVAFADSVSSGTITLNITSPSGLTTTVSQDVSMSMTPVPGSTSCSP